MYNNDQRLIFEDSKRYTDQEVMKLLERLKLLEARVLDLEMTNVRLK